MWTVNDDYSFLTLAIIILKTQTLQCVRCTDMRSWLRFTGFGESLGHGRDDDAFGSWSERQLLDWWLRLN